MEIPVRLVGAAEPEEEAEVAATGTGLGWRRGRGNTISTSALK